MRHERRAKGVAKGEGFARDEGVDEDGSWTRERTRVKRKYVGTEERLMDEEQRVGPMGQHRHGVRGDGMWVETRSTG